MVGVLKVHKRTATFEEKAATWTVISGLLQSSGLSTILACDSSSSRGIPGKNLFVSSHSNRSSTKTHQMDCGSHLGSSYHHRGGGTLRAF